MLRETEKIDSCNFKKAQEQYLCKQMKWILLSICELGESISLQVLIWTFSQCYVAYCYMLLKDFPILIECESEGTFNFVCFSDITLFFEPLAWR